ncbi:unnamed protein product [Phytophthora lilii]|uniref:Unnamed protein product n=1 Tax=Phytophthora lilii TaxID=2077276 RepID=A0A9W6TWD9_9STRA|nr:unnamed protein product [Phytophthora lilii]
MSDERVTASRSDTSASLLLVDTRASQSLEPIRLPGKLRDRIERAQRRAIAAKDGVSIFTKDSKDSVASGPASAVGRRSITAETTTAANLGEIGELHRASTATGTNGGADDKMHLPDVILSHKMRDFEARANTGGGVALFSVEPADRSLQKLSLEDRERVMLVMQSKIRQIASDVDANFARITKALDANGIFDSSANIQRAQTLCLVDLQRRCKLDRLRDEAMREVLHLPTSSKGNSSAWPSQTAPSKPFHKLSQLLRPPSRAQSAETASTTIYTPGVNRRKRMPVRVSKLPAIRTPSGSPSKKNTKNNQASLSPSPQSRQQDKEKIDSSKGPVLVRMQSRRGGLAPPSTTSQHVAREDVGFSIVAANAGANDSDLYARHPHVAQVLQLLGAGESSSNKASNLFTINSLNSAEADMEHVRMLDPVDEWMQRSPSYQAVGARAGEALRRCGERQRWDTLGHFGLNFSGVASISVELRQRLEDQHSSWEKGEDSPRSDDVDDIDRAASVGKSGKNNQQQRDKDIYAELQVRIRERLIANERRTRTAAAAVRTVGASSTIRQPQTAPAKIIVSTSSTTSLPVGGASQPRGNLFQSSGVASPVLGISASEPVLSAAIATGAHFSAALNARSSSPQKHSRLGTRGRMSVLEQKIMIDPSQPISRHGRRKESLIGAPRAQLDNMAIGRHSEARIAYRRDTAQTWAWHLPPGTTAGGVNTIEEEEENNEAKDYFDEEDCEQGDGEDDSEEGEEGGDGTEYGDDDVESVDSSRTSFSARSSLSMSSVKRRTSSGNRKHAKSKRPPAVQRRSSRGPGGRSAGNTLTGHALSLHARLEVIWRVLQFPFSNKLAMLERLSTLQDADAFISALEHWERVTPLVAIRQRMKLALSGFAERGELRPNEWLTPTEFTLVAALPLPSSTKEPTSGTVPPLISSLREFDSMSPSAFVHWVSLTHFSVLLPCLTLYTFAMQVRDHIDAVTLQTQKLANDLKVHTGEELQFQGHPYPRRG